MKRLIEDIQNGKRDIPEEFTIALIEYLQLAEKHHDHHYSPEIIHQDAARAKELMAKMSLYRG